MTIAHLLKIINTNLSTGTLFPEDEVVIEIDTEKINIKSVECDTHSSDFLIIGENS